VGPREEGRRGWEWERGEGKRRGRREGRRRGSGEKGIKEKSETKRKWGEGEVFASVKIKSWVWPWQQKAAGITRQKTALSSPG